MKKIETIKFDDLRESWSVIGKDEMDLFWAGGNAQGLIDAMIAANSNCGAVNVISYGFGNVNPYTGTITIGGAQFVVTFMFGGSKYHPSIDACVAGDSKLLMDGRLLYTFNNSTAPSANTFGLKISVPKSAEAYFDNYLRVPK